MSRRQKLKLARAPEPVMIETPEPYPRGLSLKFTLNEWRVLTGFEVNGKRGVRLDIYLGIGPILATLHL